MKYSALLSILLLQSAPASACSIVFPPPEKVFSDSQLAVLARPVEISYRPKQASKPSYAGDFRQTILWEVLLGWKGGLKSGDRFTTRRNFYALPPCTSYFPIHNKSAYLIFGRGRAPYEDFHAHDPAHSSDAFLFLSKVPVQ